MKKVLIVDDLPENLYLLQMVLNNYGYEVSTAPDGALALAAARGNPPDIVIADILMPVMDGFTLCRQWRQDPLLWRIPFIFYTATYTDAKDEQFALSLGADRFISKPAEPDVIVQAVQQLLSGAGGVAKAKSQGLAPETVYLREYNETLIRKLEDKLKELEAANAELRALDGIKNNLLSNVSHELRTPLVAVRGYAEMIANGKSGPVSEQQREQCEVMLRNTDRLLALIDNLLNLASEGKSAESLRPGTFPAADLLAEVTDLLQAKAQAKNITMRCAGGTVQVHADRRLLLHVLINLADNAVKFTPAGGTVTLAAAMTDSGVRLSIRDSGCGIEQQQQQRIFERFYQVDSSSTREHGGIGIGLSIAAEIIRRHNGRVAVSSSPGAGAEFTVELPQPCPEG